MDNQDNNMLFFASCPKGVEELLATELAALGAEPERQTVGGVFVRTDRAGMYRLCLGSRLANRLVRVLVQTTFRNADELYAAVRAIEWPALFACQHSIAVDFTGSNDAIRHGNYGAQRVKDAVVDRFYADQDRRPDVNPKAPDVQLYAHVRRNRLLVGIDVSGSSLHRRGYRLDGAKAPLKENLAAALAMRAGLQRGDQRQLIDPFCGSGTLLIEAVMIRLGIAPGLLRERFGFECLALHDDALWQQLHSDAVRQCREAIAAAGAEAPLALGFDQDARMVGAAASNAARAGLGDLIEFRQRALQDFSLAQDHAPVLLLTNPPYGERLQDRDGLFQLYRLLGEKLRAYCQGSQAWVLCSDAHLLKSIGLQKSKSCPFYNGAMAVEWVRYDIYARQQGEQVRDEKYDEAITMIENRLRKNSKKLQKWLERNAIDCYRLYDADMPEYAFALDCYHDRFHMAEYAPPKSVDAYAAFMRRRQFEQAVRNVFGLTGGQLVVKERKRQKGREQYQRQDQRQEFFPVREGRAELMVNLTDYLDTGLFLDHRPVRLMIAEMAAGKRFLNLFCYSAAATVHAALGGASESVSVDMSQTYLDWAARNFARNRLDTRRHQLLRADVMKWLAAPTVAGKFDLIFLDPPSFSNSKRMEGVLDIQRDHALLVGMAMELLADDGLLLFSNNRRDFRLDDGLRLKFSVSDISRKTIDADFERNPKIHQCWRITHLQQPGKN